MASVRETVRYFDMKNQIMPGASVLIIGKRCSGKSNLLFDQLSHIGHYFNYGLALTPTQSSRRKFEACMPASLIDRQSVERLDQYVSTVNSEYDKAVALGKKPKTTYLLCDDTAYDDKFMRCKTLSEVFLNGRNFGMTCILVLQYLMKVGPDLRGNADFVFIFWDNNTQDKIYDFWFRMMPKHVFKEVFAACTQDFSCLVLDVRKSATSRDWHDCVFWYKAKLPGEIEPFTMCDPDFFRLNDYCRARDADERRAKSSNSDTVWRLGPDGNIFDNQIPAA
jgi:hypothetical protein